MSSLPLRFLESWQAKQFSLRIGATSLMKLTGALVAGDCAAPRDVWIERRTSPTTRQEGTFSRDATAERALGGSMRTLQREKYMEGRAPKESKSGRAGGQVRYP